MSLEALSVTLTGRTSKLADEEVFLLSRIVGGPEKSPWMQKLKCQALGSTQSDESPLTPGVGKNVAFIACCQEVCLISAVPVHSTSFVSNPLQISGYVHNSEPRLFFFLTCKVMFCVSSS